ncbi:hypothetical protein EST38_g7000 [Candolleomyces aberdarensis]|uniref:Uncharacterized protein n=1 Tax=Candolleomyces aberdarensis TaxID=2316362 RepID=A0A4Q2DJ54_9AGAR|nr:hypothetical protein EST38_g7000 [Candolleomyces aberdarensis]
MSNYSDDSSDTDEDSQPTMIQDSSQESNSNLPQYQLKNCRLAQERAAQGDEETDENDGYGPSTYNDNKGIKVSVTLTEYDDPAKRKRANSKAVTHTVAVHFHEDFRFQDWFVKILTALGQDPTHLHTEEDFETMVSEAALLDKSKDGARVNVGVKELLKASRSTRDNSGVDDESDDSDDAGRKKTSKQKKLDFPPEEKEQLKIIQDLTDHYRCNDKQCSNTTCYLAGPTGKHINLTHLHLRTWAAAIQGNKEGADMDTPPNNKLFDASCPPSVADAALPVPALPVAPASNLLEPMDLDDFCMLFGISYGLKLKLEDADITGPHVLWLVSNTDLRSDAKLSIGELATLRNAEERWKVRQTAL